jgi:tRNA nucleotidyltransferase (CCA-adding enzyme)
MKQVKSCGVVIFRTSLKVDCDSGNFREYLIIRQRKHVPEHWDFPKGHVEENETEEQTALREVLEETNIRTNIISGFREEIHFNPKPTTDKIVVFFVGQAINNDVIVQEKEISGFEWLNFNDATKKLTFDISKKLLAKAETFLNK